MIAEAKIAALKAGRLKAEQLDWFEWRVGAVGPNRRVGVLAQLRGTRGVEVPPLEFADPADEERATCLHCGREVVEASGGLTHATQDGRPGFLSCRSASRTWMQDPLSGRRHLVWDESLNRRSVATVR
jgi:hypothetical protein